PQRIIPTERSDRKAVMAMESRAVRMHGGWQRLKARWMTRLWYARLFGRFGPRSRVAPPLHVLHPERAAVGSGVTIGPGCRIETHPPPLPSRKAPPLLAIGDRVRIGGHVRLVSCTSLIIGDGAQIEDGCLITDCEDEGAPDGQAYSREPKTGRPAVIGEGAWIGAGTVVLAGSRIGIRAIVLPGSVVDGDIPPWTLAAGQPARVIRVFDKTSRRWLPAAGAGAPGDAGNGIVPGIGAMDAARIAASAEAAAGTDAGREARGDGGTVAGAGNAAAERVAAGRAAAAAEQAAEKCAAAGQAAAEHAAAERIVAEHAAAERIVAEPAATDQAAAERAAGSAGDASPVDGKNAG